MKVRELRTWSLEIRDESVLRLKSRVGSQVYLCMYTAVREHITSNNSKAFGRYLESNNWISCDNAD